MEQELIECLENKKASYTEVMDHTTDIKDPDYTIRNFYRGVIFGIELALKEIEVANV